MSLQVRQIRMSSLSGSLSLLTSNVGGFARFESFHMLTIITLGVDKE
jgi:hypothetical protein